jgi:hypothetical protein
MQKTISLVTATALTLSQLAVPIQAAAADRLAQSSAGKHGGDRTPSRAAQGRSTYAASANKIEKNNAGVTRSSNTKATTQSQQRSTNQTSRSLSTTTKNTTTQSAQRTRVDAHTDRSENNIRTSSNVSNNRINSGNNTVVSGNTVVVAGKNGHNYHYPVYQTPNGGYYRPPNGGYYVPPRPPVGGWYGGYFPPPRYYYDDGPSVGDVIAGVAVTASLLALLSAATQPQPPQTAYVQGMPPPMMTPYVPPPKSTGAPASINVDLGAMTPEARPTASVCLTEAARQIGATGGTEIRIERIVDVEKGDGGYRVRLDLLGVYSDATRTIPMYCRATPEKIIELTFG